jgi:SAM-dependent methyltransferase
VTPRGWLRAIREWLGIGEARPSPSPPMPRPPVLAEAELLARAEEFNRRAEVYWQDVRDEPSGRAHVLNKPFASVADAPGVLYRLGLALSELDLGLGHTVLDFGAGSCWLSSCLNRLGCRTIALDISPTALELGRELFRLDSRHRPQLEPRFLPYDGHRIPLPDASVDRVICFDAFHHVPNQDEVLSEIHRVLRGGGRAVLAEPGEGHSHGELSLFEVGRCGVLENELEVGELDERARRAGFTDVRLKPYPDPDTLALSAIEYRRLLEGDLAVFPLRALQESLRRFFLVTLMKGEPVRDSRNPGRLAALIQRRGPEGALRGGGGALLELPLTVRNTGDTHWRHELDEVGGYVMLAGHLLDPGGGLLRQGFFRTPLPGPVAPGAAVDLLAEVPLPAELGHYLLRIDLVDERLMWFSQAGSPTLDLALQVDSHAPGTDPEGLRALLSASLPAGGLKAAGGVLVAFPVRLSNRGQEGWPNAPEPRPGSVSLAGHLLDGQGQVMTRDVLHLPLPRPVAPGEEVEMSCVLRAPLAPGRYRLKLDLVMELVCWFEQRGSPPLEVDLVVTEETPDSTNPGLLRAMIELVEAAPPRARPKTRLSLRLRLTNVGNTLWRCRPPGGRGQVALGGHLLDERREVLARDHLRTRLPRDVPPGDRLEIRAQVEVPSAPGRYALELDMVDEGIAWFGPLGSPTLPVPFEVAGEPS